MLEIGQTLDVCVFCAPYVMGVGELEDYAKMYGRRAADAMEVVIDSLGLVTEIGTAEHGRYWDCPICNEVVIGDGVRIQRDR